MLMISILPFAICSCYKEVFVILSLFRAVCVRLQAQEEKNHTKVCIKKNMPATDQVHYE